MCSNIGLIRPFNYLNILYASHLPQYKPLPLPSCSSLIYQITPGLKYPTLLEYKTLVSVLRIPIRMDRLQPQGIFRKPGL
jgi:hypothetical protein